MSDQPIPIQTSLDIAAPPAKVWSVVSDVKRMPQFSPELRKIVLLGRRNGVGQRMLGINRRKLVVWPTTSKIVRWEPERAVAWHTQESGATWIYELEPTEVDGAPGTRLTARRELGAFTLGSKLLTPVLGGAIGHDHELADGLASTLRRMKQVIER